MTEQEKIAFIVTHLDAIKEKLEQDIRAGRIPEGWAGLELRKLMAERAGRLVMPMSSAATRNYNNDVLVNNL